MEQQVAHPATQDTSDAWQPEEQHIVTINVDDFDRGRDNLNYMTGHIDYHPYTSFDGDLAGTFHGSGDSADLTNTIHDPNHSLVSLETPYNGPQSSPQEDYTFDVLEYLDGSSFPPPMDGTIDPAYLSSSSSGFSHSPYLSSSSSINVESGPPYSDYSRPPSVGPSLSTSAEVYSPNPLSPSPYVSHAQSAPPSPSVNAMSSTFDGMAIGSNDHGGNPLRLDGNGHLILPDLEDPSFPSNPDNTTLSSSYLPSHSPTSAEGHSPHLLSPLCIPLGQHPWTAPPSPSINSGSGHMGISANDHGVNIARHSRWLSADNIVHPTSPALGASLRRTVSDISHHPSRQLRSDGNGPLTLQVPEGPSFPSNPDNTTRASYLGSHSPTSAEVRSPDLLFPHYVPAGQHARNAPPSPSINNGSGHMGISASDHGANTARHSRWLSADNIVHPTSPALGASLRRTVSDISHNPSRQLRPDGNGPLTLQVPEGPSFPSNLDNTTRVSYLGSHSPTSPEVLSPDLLSPHYVPPGQHPWTAPPSPSINSGSDHMAISGGDRGGNTARHSRWPSADSIHPTSPVLGASLQRSVSDSSHYYPHGPDPNVASGSGHSFDIFADSRPSEGDGAMKKVGSPNMQAAAKKRRRHTPRFSCDLEDCDSTFTSRSKLLQHDNSHKGIKQYACSFPGCDRTFVSRSDRNRHEETSKMHEQHRLRGLER